MRTQLLWIGVSLPWLWATVDAAPPTIPCAKPLTPQTAAERRRPPAAVPDETHATSEHDPAKCVGGSCPASSYVRDVIGDRHIIGVYESRDSEFDSSGTFHAGGPIKVIVHRTAQPVDLVLTSYEAVEWEVTTVDGGRVRSVVVASFQPGSRVVNKLAGITPRSATGLGYGYQWEPDHDSEPGEFTKFLAEARRAVGGNEASFQGSYTGATFHIPFATSASAALDRERAAVRDRAIQKIEVPTPAELASLDSSKCPPQSNHQRCSAGYLLTDHGVRDLNANVDYPFPLALAKLSWKTGITFDSARKRIIVVTMGGVGAALAFDLRAKQWSVIASMKNVDVAELAYDEVRDAVWATEALSGTVRTLLRFSANFDSVTKLELTAPIVRDRLVPVGLAVAGGLLVLSDAHGPRKFAIDPQCGEVHPL